MKLTELIAAVGEEKIAVQELNPAITNVSSKRKQRGMDISAVTFLTTHIRPGDLVVPGGEIGLVLWIKARRHSGEHAMSLSKRKAEARAAYAKSLSEPASPTRKAILQNPSGEVKRLLEWERSTPRCENCKHVLREKTLMHKATQRLPVVIVPPVCQRGKFYTLAGALCKHWAGKDGSTLETEQ